MITKWGHIDCPRELLQEVIADIPAWPSWMPGVLEVRILQRQETAVRLFLKSSLLGHTFEQEVEFVQQGTSFKQRQLAGRFKKWDADWRLQESPERKGTILNVSLDIDLGFLGMFVSSRTVNNAINDWFNQLTQARRNAATDWPGSASRRRSRQLLRQRCRYRKAKR